MRASPTISALCKAHTSLVKARISLPDEYLAILRFAESLIVFCQPKGINSYFIANEQIAT
jgi:hypothetical protein